MIKYFFSISLLFLAILFSSCSNNTEPTNPNKFEISSEPISIEFNVSLDSLHIENFPNYSIEYSALRLNGVDLTTVKYYYPAQNSNVEVDREFVVNTYGSFEVEIKNCESESNWLVELGTVELADNSWINSEISLLRTEKAINADNTINYKFVFKALKGGKGYICFVEKNDIGEISSNESHGLLIGYTINPLPKIILNITEIKWRYNTEEGTFSTVSVNLKGTVNSYRLRGMSYGDGVIMAKEIPVQNNNNFDIEIPVAFSHIEGVILKTNTELLLYGTIGLPKVIPIKNPRSN